jgi:hypothetical protein
VLMFPVIGPRYLFWKLDLPTGWAFLLTFLVIVVVLSVALCRFKIARFIVPSIIVIYTFWSLLIAYVISGINAAGRS